MIERGRSISLRTEKLNCMKCSVKEWFCFVHPPSWTTVPQSLCLYLNARKKGIYVALNCIQRRVFIVLRKSKWRVLSLLLRRGRWRPVWSCKLLLLRMQSFTWWCRAPLWHMWPEQREELTLWASASSPLVFLLLCSWFLILDSDL